LNPLQPYVLRCFKTGTGCALIKVQAETNKPTKKQGYKMNIEITSQYTATEIENFSAILVKKGHDPEGQDFEEILEAMLVMNL
jgi:hypothetical protein